MTAASLLKSQVMKRVTALLCLAEAYSRGAATPSKRIRVSANVVGIARSSAKLRPSPMLNSGTNTTAMAIMHPLNPARETSRVPLARLMAPHFPALQ